MMAGIKVNFAPKFATHLLNFPKADREKILHFVRHVEQFGFAGLIGRNKPSVCVPTNDPHWLAKVKYAQAHHLWHYHIGIPTYHASDDGQTSEYVLHYTRVQRKIGLEITLIAMSAHPPFELPSPEQLV